MKTTKKRTIAISVLAVLLVALLAFNVTYAYFTDKVTSDHTLDFGTVDVNATGLTIEPNGTGVTLDNFLPGDTFAMEGTLANAGTSAFWLYFGVRESSVKLSYGAEVLWDGTNFGTNVAADNDSINTNSTVKNTSYDHKYVPAVGTQGESGYIAPHHDDSDGAGYYYIQADVTAMKNLVVAQISGAVAAYVNSILPTTPQPDYTWQLETGANGTLAGMSVNPIPTTAAQLNLAGGTFSIPAATFGNIFQGVSIDFTIEILAIQTEGTTAANAINVTQAQARTAFENAAYDWVNGTTAIA